MHAHKPTFFFFCDYPLRNSFLPLSFPFCRPFYFRYLLRSIFFLAAVKSWVLIMGKAYWELGPWSIIGIVGHFTNIFAPKLTTLFSNLLRQNVVDIQTDCCADRSILAILSAYQEYLVTFKLMTSQVVKRARLLRTCTYVLGAKGLINLYINWNWHVFVGVLLNPLNTNYAYMRN